MGSDPCFRQVLTLCIVGFQIEGADMLFGS